jgi:hypothetical protein
MFVDFKRSGTSAAFSRCCACFNELREFTTSSYYLRSGRQFVWEKWLLLQIGSLCLLPYWKDHAQFTNAAILLLTSSPPTERARLEEG